MSWYNDPDFTSYRYYEYNKDEKKEHYAKAVVDDDTGKLEYQYLIKHPQLKED